MISDSVHYSNKKHTQYCIQRYSSNCEIKIQNQQKVAL